MYQVIALRNIGTKDQVSVVSLGDGSFFLFRLLFRENFPNDSLDSIVIFDIVAVFLHVTKRAAAEFQNVQPYSFPRNSLLPLYRTVLRVLLENNGL